MFGTPSNYSDFDIYRVNFPDGSSYIFDDEQLFFNFCNSISPYLSSSKSFVDSIFFPSVLSVAIASALGVSPPPVLSSF
jgi:hypothetical protein